MTTATMAARLMVQEVSSEEIGLAHKAVFRTQIKALAGSVSSGQGSWTYAQALENVRGGHVEGNAVYDAL